MHTVKISLKIIIIYKKSYCICCVYLDETDFFFSSWLLGAVQIHPAVIATTDPGKGLRSVRGLYGAGSKGVVVEGNHLLREKRALFFCCKTTGTRFQSNCTTLRGGGMKKGKEEEEEERNRQSGKGTKDCNVEGGMVGKPLAWGKLC